MNKLTCKNEKTMVLIYRLKIILIGGTVIRLIKRV